MLQKRFDSPDGLEGLGPLLQPTLQVVPTPDEYALLAGERLFSWGSLVTAVAAQYPFMTIRNTGLNTLAVVEVIAVTISGNSDVALIWQSSPTTGATAFSRDQRSQTGGLVRVGVATDAAASSGAPWAWVEQVEANIARRLSVPPLILAPQSVLTVVGGTVNQAGRFSVAWRERTMESSETAQL